LEGKVGHTEERNWVICIIFRPTFLRCTES
jgi:hypothetical protein